MCYSKFIDILHCALLKRECQTTSDWHGVGNYLSGSLENNVTLSQFNDEIVPIRKNSNR